MEIFHANRLQYTHYKNREEEMQSSGYKQTTVAYGNTPGEAHKCCNFTVFMAYFTEKCIKICFFRRKVVNLHSF